MWNQPQWECWHHGHWQLRKAEHLLLSSPENLLLNIYKHAADWDFRDGREWLSSHLPSPTQVPLTGSSCLEVCILRRLRLHGEPARTVKRCLSQARRENWQQQCHVLASLILKMGKQRPRERRDRAEARSQISQLLVQWSFQGSTEIVHSRLSGFS